jgi:tRNA threonylcarbamoyl adenosine modification protein (Sua5/YciO/YrdC/YwlC family)
VIGSVDDARAALRAGRVVAVPTDTVYGVAATLDAASALFTVKQRPHDVPLPVLIADVAQLDGIVVQPLPAPATALISRWWPGPLTVVVDRDPGFTVDLGGAGDAERTVGVRLPDAAVVRALCASVGPLAVTSANLHGRPTPVEAAGVAAALGDAVAVVVDGGRCEGLPSTVVRVTAAGAVQVLRRGAAAVDEHGR